MWGQLTIIHTESWVYVAPIHDPEDWVARFEKAHEFPAQEWAERMVALHNSELRTRVVRGTTPPMLSAYAPFDPRRATDVDSLNASTLDPEVEA